MNIEITTQSLSNLALITQTQYRKRRSEKHPIKQNRSDRSKQYAIQKIRVQTAQMRMTVKIVHFLMQHFSIWFYYSMKLY